MASEVDWRNKGELLSISDDSQDKAPEYTSKNFDLSLRAYQALDDVNILQILLTLEHLETQMYIEMLGAHELTGKEIDYFSAFGSHETAHALILSDALRRMSATPVRPRASYNFPAFSSRQAILEFAQSIEEISVGIYQSAIDSIANRELIRLIGSIMQIEARHLAISNLLLGGKPAPSSVTLTVPFLAANERLTPILNG